MRPEVNERGRHARADTKNQHNRRSLRRVLGARNSNPILAGDGRKVHQSARRRAEERGSDGREGQRKTARIGTQESVKKEQCQPQAKKQCQQQAKKLIRDGSEKTGVLPRGDSSRPRGTDKD